ncbi:DUF2184 domain-containing protein [Martelella lutilitoris]|uniref:DUF2184 domain-containing protein n=1 Tax=Martelella lutilitoris TaxID=2583532 RepID=A0A7T7KK60_9HYPH|nr:major capsid family protein [Martelella lutilitoris]QQM29301.1 DUF2184 domain-containing protein [Martelella lutilitoris]
MNFQMLDAQAALGFVLSQTTHIESAVNETVYPDIQYPELIPVDTSANPWAQTVTYYSSDKYGAADWINGNAGDIPLAGTERAKFQTNVYTAGIGYGYGLEEISQAAMLGINLANDDAMAARRAYEEMVDRVALQGDATKNFEGLIANSAVTAVSATTGAWATATPDEIVGDFNQGITGVQTATNYTSMSDTVLLPNEKLNYIASTRLTDTSMTVLEFIRRNNVYTATTGQPLTIRAVRGLTTAGAGSTARMITYRRDPQVLKMHIPMPHRFLPAFQKTPLYVEVPGIFRLGGLDIRRPAEVRYVDGI